MAPQNGGEKKFKPLTKKQQQLFLKLLLEERKRVLKELGQWDETLSNTQQGADGDLSSYSFHMADQGTDAMEREKAFLFASKEGRYLWHVNQALRRLYKSPDTFGQCQHCGGEIAVERLEALYQRQPSSDLLAALGRLDPDSARQRERTLAHLQQHGALSAAQALLATPCAAATEDEAKALRDAVARAARPLQRYRCAACAFEAQNYFWQCPGCLGWDTYPPQRQEDL